MVTNSVFTINHYFDIFCVSNIFDLERICVLSRQGYPTSNESSAKNPTMNHAPVRGEIV